jgi:hypothetical protein
MADDAKRLLKLRQTKVNIKENAGKLPGGKSESGVPKDCTSCNNPSWDKTPRKS